MIFEKSLMSCQSGNSYIVTTGDTLFLIAQQKLGDGNRWHEILKPDGTQFTEAQASSLQTGQEICIPQTDTTSPSPNSGFSNIVSRNIYETIFPERNNLYTYDSLVRAVETYPSFCNEGSQEQCQRESAAFLANIAHETGDLRYVEEIGCEDGRCAEQYCDRNNATYACIAGKSYHGRGPIQLSWNYNYGACGQAIGQDLLNHPELVSTDSIISFMTALWFWMTPQSPKPSCHEAIRTSGFGKTIYIINGGIECKKPPTEAALHRIQLYNQFTERLGVTPGENLSC